MMVDERKEDAGTSTRPYHHRRRRRRRRPTRSESDDDQRAFRGRGAKETWSSIAR